MPIRDYNSLLAALRYLADCTIHQVRLSLLMSSKDSNRPSNLPHSAIIELVVISTLVQLLDL